MKIRKDGCNDLQYGFRYDEEQNAIEFHYSFTHGIPDDTASVVDLHFRPHIRRYSRGRKPCASDPLFDDPEKMRAAMREADRLFSAELGEALDIAIQLLCHDVAARVGLLLTDEGEMGKKLADAFKRERSKRLAIRTGPKKGQKWTQKKSHPYPNATFISDQLNPAIVCLNQQDKATTREAVAQYLRMGSAKSLDRKRKICADLLSWPNRVREALFEK